MNHFGSSQYFVHLSKFTKSHAAGIHVSAALNPKVKCTYKKTSELLTQSSFQNAVSYKIKLPNANHSLPRKGFCGRLKSISVDRGGNGPCSAFYSLRNQSNFCGSLESRNEASTNLSHGSNRSRLLGQTASVNRSFPRSLSSGSHSFLKNKCMSQSYCRTNPGCGSVRCASNTSFHKFKQTDRDLDKRKIIENSRSPLLNKVFDTILECKESTDGFEKAGHKASVENGPIKKVSTGKYKLKKCIGAPGGYQREADVHSYKSNKVHKSLYSYADKPSSSPRDNIVVGNSIDRHHAMFEPVSQKLRNTNSQESNTVQSLPHRSPYNFVQERVAPKNSSIVNNSLFLSTNTVNKINSFFKRGKDSKDISVKLSKKGSAPQIPDVDTVDNSVSSTRRSLLDLFRSVDKSTIIIQKDFYIKEKIANKINNNRSDSIKTNKLKTESHNMESNNTFAVSTDVNLLNTPFPSYSGKLNHFNPIKFKLDNSPKSILFDSSGKEGSYSQPRASDSLFNYLAKKVNEKEVKDYNEGDRFGENFMLSSKFYGNREFIPLIAKPGPTNGSLLFNCPISNEVVRSSAGVLKRKDSSNILKAYHSDKQLNQNVANNSPPSKFPSLVSKTVIDALTINGQTEIKIVNTKNYLDDGRPSPYLVESYLQVKGKEEELRKQREIIEGVKLHLEKDEGGVRKKTGNRLAVYPGEQATNTDSIDHALSPSNLAILSSNDQVTNAPSVNHPQLSTPISSDAISPVKSLSLQTSVESQVSAINPSTSPVEPYIVPDSSSVSSLIWSSTNYQSTPSAPATLFSSASSRSTPAPEVAASSALSSPPTTLPSSASSGSTPAPEEAASSTLLSAPTTFPSSDSSESTQATEVAGSRTLPSASATLPSPVSSGSPSALEVTPSPTLPNYFPFSAPTVTTPSPTPAPSSVPAVAASTPQTLSPSSANVPEKSSINYPTPNPLYNSSLLSTPNPIPFSPKPISVQDASVVLTPKSQSPQTNSPEKSVSSSNALTVVPKSSSDLNRTSDLSKSTSGTNFNPNSGDSYSKPVQTGSPIPVVKENVSSDKGNIGINVNEDSKESSPSKSDGKLTEPILYSTSDKFEPNSSLSQSNIPEPTYEESVDKMRKKFVGNSFDSSTPNSMSKPLQPKKVFLKSVKVVDHKSEGKRKIKSDMDHRSFLSESEPVEINPYLERRGKQRENKKLNNRFVEKNAKSKKKNDASRNDLKPAPNDSSKVTELIDRYILENYEELSQYYLDIIHAPSPKPPPENVPFTRDIIKPIYEIPVEKITSFPLANPKKDSAGFVKPKEGILNIDLLSNPMLSSKYAALPSVSRILNDTMSVTSQKALARWKERMTQEMGQDKFASFQQEQLQQGKDMHRAIKEKLMAKEPNKKKAKATNEPVASSRPSNEITERSLSSVSPVLEEISDVIAVESFVVHPLLGYKGILDCIARYREKPILIEWKLCSKSKSELKSTYDAPLQLLAYLGALNFDKNYNVQLDGVMIVVAHLDGTPADTFLIPAEDCKKFWHLWLRRLKKYSKKFNELQ